MWNPGTGRGPVPAGVGHDRRRRATPSRSNDAGRQISVVIASAMSTVPRGCTTAKTPRMSIGGWPASSCARPGALCTFSDTCSFAGAQSSRERVARPDEPDPLANSALRERSMRRATDPERSPPRPGCVPQRTSTGTDSASEHNGATLSRESWQMWPRSLQIGAAGEREKFDPRYLPCNQTHEYRCYVT